MDTKTEILISALQRIMNHQTRADRRKRGMVDISEVNDLQRIAEVALREYAQVTK